MRRSLRAKAERKSLGYAARIGVSGLTLLVTFLMLRDQPEPSYSLCATLFSDKYYGKVCADAMTVTSKYVVARTANTSGAAGVFSRYIQLESSAQQINQDLATSAFIPLGADCSVFETQEGGEKHATSEEAPISHTKCWRLDIDPGKQRGKTTFSTVTLKIDKKYKDANFSVKAFHTEKRVVKFGDRNGWSYFDREFTKEFRKGDLVFTNGAYQFSFGITQPLEVTLTASRSVLHRVGQWPGTGVSIERLMVSSLSQKAGTLGQQGALLQAKFHTTDKGDLYLSADMLLRSTHEGEAGIVLMVKSREASLELPVLAARMVFPRRLIIGKRLAMLNGEVYDSLVEGQSIEKMEALLQKFY